MNRSLNKSLLFLFLILVHPLFIISAEDGGSEKKNNISSAKNIYRVFTESRDGKDIWIVDGALVRRKLFPEFLYGGNNERYPFVPLNEIWIDNSISAEEYKYTLEHELNERNLMAKRGISYADAHDSSLALERSMRLNDKEYAFEHEKNLKLVAPIDCDNIKEINSLPDSVKLHNIYRQFIGLRKNISVWVVDGAVVRRDIYPDFGLSGNDLAYHFIPINEIWIDAQISCEETEFSITSELKERELMLKGMNYDDAYTKALTVVKKQRNKLFRMAAKHPPVVIPRILIRDTGTGSEK